MNALVKALFLIRRHCTSRSHMIDERPGRLIAVARDPQASTAHCEDANHFVLAGAVTGQGRDIESSSSGPDRRGSSVWRGMSRTAARLK